MTFCQDSWGKWAAGSVVRCVDICSAQLVMRHSRVSQSSKDTQALKDFLLILLLSALVLEERKKNRLQINWFLENVEIFGSEIHYLQVWSLKGGPESLYGTRGSRARRTIAGPLAKKWGELWGTSVAVNFRKEPTSRDFWEMLSILSFCLCHSSFTSS